MKIIFATLLGCMLGYAVAQQFADDDEYYESSEDHFTLECRTALNSTLDCSWLLGDYDSGELPDLSNEQLKSICTPKCADSLPKVQKKIHAACPYKNNKIKFEDGQYVAATITVDRLVDSHQKLCFKDLESGSFCYEMMREWEDKGAEDKHQCSDCMLGLQEVYLNSTESFDNEAYEEFTSLTKGCKKTSFHPPTPPCTTDTTASMTGPSTPTQTCASTYTIVEKDTCNGICKKHNVSTDALTYLNNIPAYCAELPKPGTELCMPEQCDIYTVKKNDTCYSIASKVPSHITVTQLLSWNPNINSICSNMEQQEGMQICVSPPGQSNEDPSTNDGGPKESATPAPQPKNVAEGTNTRCAKYYNVTTGDNCADVTLIQGISLEDFYFLNSGVDKNCTNLLLGQSYCVAAVGEIDTYEGYGSTGSVQTSATATSSPERLTFTPVEPTRDNGAWILTPGAKNPHATSKPTTKTATTTSEYESEFMTNPVAPGSYNSSRCGFYKEFWDMPDEASTKELNSCEFLAEVFEVTVDELKERNPMLKDEEPCMIKKGYRWCIRPKDDSEEEPKDSSTNAATKTEAKETTLTESTKMAPSKTEKPTTGAGGTERPHKTTATTAIGSVTTRSPITDGMKKGCKTFYMVKSGDYCEKICKSNNISVKQFTSWNPDVKSDCSLVQKDYYYCVGH
ncbi:hypothetical protein FDECE_2128 [Fusarium decemcellulare]|nr:hypothetical protein FDECE_2128 [Fusarium decemcellulare]